MFLDFSSKRMVYVNYEELKAFVEGQREELDRIKRFLEAAPSYELLSTTLKQVSDRLDRDSIEDILAALEAPGPGKPGFGALDSYTTRNLIQYMKNGVPLFNSWLELPDFIAKEQKRKGAKGEVEEAKARA